MEKYIYISFLLVGLCVAEIYLHKTTKNEKKRSKLSVFYFGVAGFCNQL